mmetsp:Transcript_35205/g.69096  ORF Transcript_35205/g.69096 Transcript_35205/m.69096 type:complete len:320 (+) Transcript_35205:1-960(+)
MEPGGVSKKKKKKKSKETQRSTPSSLNSHTSPKKRKKAPEAEAPTQVGKKAKVKATNKKELLAQLDSRQQQQGADSCVLHSHTNGEEQSSAPQEQKKRNPKLHELFVKGLSKATNENTLRQYFAAFGKISSIEIVKDKKKKSRGYGFVRFEQRSAIKKALAQGRHCVDDQVFSIDKSKAPKPEARVGDVKPLTPRQIEKMEEAKKKRKQFLYDKKQARKAGKFTRKQNAVFVAELKKTTTEQQLKEYFNAFGPVAAVHIAKDKTDKQPKGFGWVVFDSNDPENLAAADKAVSAHAAKPHSVNGTKIVCKLAEPRGGSSS